MRGVPDPMHGNVTRDPGDAEAVLTEARRRGDVTEACRPEAVAHFLVASLEGAILLSKVTKDIRIMEQCVSELKGHLALYEVAP